MKNFSLLLLLLLSTSFLWGQVDIFLDKNGNAVKINPPEGYRLEGIEWGDGTFSDTEKEKNLSQKKLQEITIYLTCNSAEGTNNLLPDQPKSKTSIIVPASLTAAKLPINSSESCCDSDIPADENLVIHNIFKAMPKEELGLQMAYRNTESYATNGILLLCFNEKKEKKSKTPFAANKHFEFVEAHDHFGEMPVTVDNRPISSVESNPFRELWVSKTSLLKETEKSDSKNFRDLLSVLKKEQANYRDFNAWRYTNLAAKEARNFYVILKGTEAMGKDPGRKITIKGYYIPDGGEPIPFEKTLVINTSHDPNRTTVFPNKLNYRQLDRTSKSKTISYLVEFQNNGTAAATDVYIKMPLSENLDPKSLKILDYYSKKECFPCTAIKNANCLDTIFTQDTLTFHFKGISLPGTKTTKIKKNGKVVEKKGEDVKKRDTQGFIEFSLTTKHRHKKNKAGKTTKIKVLKKKDFLAQASIIFDQNEPIITNQAESKFKIGLSPGIKFAYNWDKNKEFTSKNAFIGLTLSPYRAKFYPQIEFLYSLDDFASLEYFTVSAENAAGTSIFYQRIGSGKLFHIPLLAKLDNQFMSIGLGVQLEFSFFDLVELIRVDKFPQDINPSEIVELTDINQAKTEITSSIIGEISLGKVQKGPSIGVRGMVPPTDLKNYNFQLFAVWKL